MSIRIDLDGAGQAREIIMSIQTSSYRVAESTLNDYSSRLPKWVAREVNKQYKIAGGGGATAKVNEIGRIRFSGGGLKRTLRVKGRTLTPLHFGLNSSKPKKYKKVGKKSRRVIPGQGIAYKGKHGNFATISRIAPTYNFTIEIERGNVQPLRGKYNTPWFFAPAKKGNEKQIPFQRSPGDQKGFKMVSAKTISLPQMVSDDKEHMKPEIVAGVLPDMEKRFNHYLNRYLGR